MYEVSCCKLARYTRQGSKFLEMADKILNLSPVEEVLKQGLGKRSDVTGILCYPVLSMFKVLLLQVWYSLSDRGIDEALFGQTSFRKFAGFSPMDNTPSYSTICRFRNKLVKFKILDKLFALVVKSLERKGLINSGSLIIDSTIVACSRKHKKVIDITHEVPLIYYSKDEDATWTNKSSYLYYGFKIHMSVDAEHGFITGGFVTGANCSDTTEFAKTICCSALKPTVAVLADKGYASRSNRDYLMHLGLKDGIMHKATRKKKLNELQKAINAEISKVRSMIERVFGTLKRKYHLHCAKYLGIAKVKGQLFLAAIALNIRKAFKFVG